MIMAWPPGWSGPDTAGPEGCPRGGQCDHQQSQEALRLARRMGCRGCTCRRQTDWGLAEQRVIVTCAMLSGAVGGGGGGKCWGLEGRRPLRTPSGGLPPTSAGLPPDR